jgi:hypothetical protein
MSKINTIIPTQAFEVIRDRIAEILTDEVAQQFTLTSDENINATVSLEDTCTNDKTDFPLISIELAKGDYDNENQGSSRGTYTFNINVFCNSKSNSTQRGDYLAAVKSQRLAGIVRAILMNSVYNKLGFAPPFVQNVSVLSIQVAQVTQHDALSTSMTRLVFQVRVNETTPFITPVLIAGYETMVKIGATELGYHYSKPE